MKTHFEILKEEQQKQEIRWRIEFYQSVSQTVNAETFEQAAKMATRIAKRLFLTVSALYRLDSDD